MPCRIKSILIFFYFVFVVRSSALGENVSQHLKRTSHGGDVFSYLGCQAAAMMPQNDNNFLSLPM
jgi:hypothetical protein